MKYWEIGNEIWGDWVRGHSDAATYARNLARYIAAMRAVDPSIKVIAVGDNDMAWNRTVLSRRTERFDYLAVHHYYSQREMDGDLRNLMARPLHYERWYGEVDAMLRELPADRRPKLAINEWGLDLPESQQHSILAALYAARLMNVFERRGDLVAMSAVSDLVNGWPGGIIQASSHGIFVTPSYLVNRLYATRLGAERLPSTVDGPTFRATRGRCRSRAGRRREPLGRWPYDLHQGGQHRPGATGDGTDPRARRCAECHASGTRGGRLAGRRERIQHA